MDEDEDELLVQVVGDEDDESADLQKLARVLLAGLTRLDVDEVELVTEESLPEGAKGLAVLAGLLKLSGRVHSELRNVINSVCDWAVRNNRSVTITLDGDTLIINAPSGDDQQRLVDLFIAKHAA
jgi:hypothetical protein